jgi:hypothetical protein
MAIEDNKIKIRPNYWPFFPNLKVEKITIGNLLNHRSGIFNFTIIQLQATIQTEIKI